MTAHASAHPGYRELHRYGLWLFIASEAFLFAILLAVRFFFTGLEKPEALNIPLGVVLTVILVSSSYTLHRGEKAAASGDQAGLRLGLLLTMGLGVVFLVIVGFEWAAGFAEFPASTPYGAVFYLITGTHAVHLLSGLLVLYSLHVQAKRGVLDEGNRWKLEAGALYWHFVDVIWLSVFTTLYVL